MVKISVASVRSGARGEYIGRGSYGKVGPRWGTRSWSDATAHAGNA